MIVPPPPTDNFYKFLSLSGVAVVISSSYFLISKLYEYKDELLQHKEELDFLLTAAHWSGVLGALFALFGFFFWFVRVQQPLDKEIKIRNELLDIQLREARANAELAEIQLKKEKASFNKTSNSNKT